VNGSLKLLKLNLALSKPVEDKESILQVFDNTYTHDYISSLIFLGILAVWF
jgi:hypothetical protein